jgi:hypothetical protein
VITSGVPALAVLDYPKLLAAVLDLSPVLLPLREAHADKPSVPMALPPALSRQPLCGLFGVVQLGETPQFALWDEQVKKALVRPAERLDVQAKLIACQLARLGRVLVA